MTRGDVAARGDGRIAILVPRRADGGPRDRLWTFIRETYEGHGWPIVEGHHEGGPFNRSAALNAAAFEAGSWDVALIVDADTHVQPPQVEAAVELAGRSGSIVYAHDRWRGVGRSGTERILRGGYHGSWAPLAESTLLNTVSSCLAIGRPLWDAVGGFDERFRGWGFEDRAFAIACATIGGAERIPGAAWHLWHPRAPRAPSDPDFIRNRELVAEYRRAAGDVAAIATLRDAALAALSRPPTGDHARTTHPPLQRDPARPRASTAATRPSQLRATAPVS